MDANEDSKTYECEWCGGEYLAEHYDYYQVKVVGEVHIICSDCYNHLKHIDGNLEE